MPLEELERAALPRRIAAVPPSAAYRAGAGGYVTPSGRRLVGSPTVDLPVMPPVAPMLAKLARELPEGDMRYEPKWDGFRCIIFRDGDEVELGSRNERPFTRYFPEWSRRRAAQLPGALRHRRRGGHRRGAGAWISMPCPSASTRPHRG